MTKAGKSQLFAAADLIAWRDGAEVLAASANAVLEGGVSGCVRVPLTKYAAA